MSAAQSAQAIQAVKDSLSSQGIDTSQLQSLAGLSPSAVDIVYFLQTGQIRPPAAANGSGGFPTLLVVILVVLVLAVAAGLVERRRRSRNATRLEPAGDSS